MHVNLRGRYEGLRRWQEAEKESLRALELLEDLAAEFPRETAFAVDAGWRQIELARVCLRQGRSAQALAWCDCAEKHFHKDHDRKSSEGSQDNLDWVPVYRARALAQLKRYPEALAEVQRCGTKPKDPFHIACAYSLLSAAALQDAKLTPPERDKLSEARAERAVELLCGIDWKNRDAADWLFEPLKTDKDLDPLRSRPDFRDLVEQVEKASAKPARK
jgi:tetratricopeptide (TPR) repeat protein